MKRASVDWQERCKIIVLDPDGWDRKNYNYSWNIEKITRKEFENRLLFSTCRGLLPLGKCIWKDFPFVLFFHISKFFKKIGKVIITELQRPSVWDVLLPKLCIILIWIVGVLSGAYVLMNIMGWLPWER